MTIDQRMGGWRKPGGRRVEPLRIGRGEGGTPGSDGQGRADRINRSFVAAAVVRSDFTAAFFTEFAEDAGLGAGAVAVALKLFLRLG